MLQCARMLLTVLACALVIGVLLGAPASHAAPQDAKSAKSTEAMPPFKVESSRKVTVDLKSNRTVCEGDVRLTSPKHITEVTCQYLEATTGTGGAFDMLARGNVVFTGTVLSKVADKPSYRIYGNAELVTFNMATGILHLEKGGDQGTRPKFILSQLAADNRTVEKKTDLSGTGETIDFNMNTMVIEMTGATTIERTGASQ